jgi:pimeloyl-ACP methyl ester carboxylesterase
MALSAEVDGFRLAYDRHGRPGAPAVVLLQGWPGGRHDHDAVAAAEVRELPGSGHFVPLEAPAAFAAALRERA